MKDCLLKLLSHGLNISKLRWTSGVSTTGKEFPPWEVASEETARFSGTFEIIMITPLSLAPKMLTYLELVCLKSSCFFVVVGVKGMLRIRMHFLGPVENFVSKLLPRL